MLPHPTLDKLQTLRLHGMLKALAEQLKTPDIDSLSFEERLGLLVDRELTERDDKRLSSRLRQARLRHNACLEDIDYRSPRGLDKALILQLRSGQWLRDGLNLIIGGPPAWVRPGWPAPWRTRPAERATACVTCACRAYWKSWAWPTATGASPS